ncbi:tRNA methyltransferase roswell isoform X3 [Oratosquilla oratoria]|uniref:tRNA methyltransferase roswell isoform X3 n=1 Tax=Oratosquilla oratoria TaxID=337810 RepID=UPI003F75800F
MFVTHLLRSAQILPCITSHYMKHLPFSLCKLHFKNVAVVQQAGNSCIEKLTHSVSLYSSTSSSEESYADTDEGIDKLALIQLEYEFYKQGGLSVPKVVTEAQWQELLEKQTRNSRRKYFKFLFLNEIKKENAKKKKEERKSKVEEKRLLEESQRQSSTEKKGHLEYGLWKNSLFLRIRDSAITHFQNGRLISAMLHNQPLVVDLSFDHCMSSREKQNCSNQLQMMFAENRKHEEPFNLYFCNAHKSFDTVTKLEKYIPTLYEPEFPLNVTEQCYLDIFPREKLVYLTPDSREELTEYDHDAVYIIGGIVDTAKSDPLTLAKAKQQGIKMGKLPLDTYLRWGSGSGKNLTLNQMILIMLDMKFTGDWRKALTHVPRRKIKTEEEISFESQLRNAKRRPVRNLPKYTHTIIKRSSNSLLVLSLALLS